MKSKKAKEKYREKLMTKQLAELEKKQGIALQVRWREMSLKAFYFTVTKVRKTIVIAPSAVLASVDKNFNLGHN